MSSKLLVSVRPIATRVAYVEDGELRDFRVEKRGEVKSLVGSIFKGKVSRVLPGMQAAFVDVNLDRAGFLYVGDVRVDIDSGSPIVITEDQEEENYESTAVDEKTPIQDLLSEGQHILVQVAKDPLGTKGARISTHVSLPGRYVVYMPTVNHIGISRRIDNETERERLKETIDKYRPERGGFIVRTAAEGAPPEALKADIEYLTRLYTQIFKQYSEKKSIGLVHSELDMDLRAVRDLASESIDEVIVDDKAVFDKVLDFAEQFIPHLSNKIKYYNEAETLFDKYEIDLEVSRSLGRKVWLKSGGYIIFDEAEALVAIDVNTGSYTGKKDLEDTILKTNLEAVKEIAVQLRIRNCGGIIVIDLIDMEKESHREMVMAALEEDLCFDKARTNITQISELGLIEMTRKRIRPSLVKTLCQPCKYCDGKGYVKTSSTIASEIFRELEREGIDNKKITTNIRVNEAIADWVYEEGSDMLEYMEQKIKRNLIFEVDRNYHIEQYRID